MSADETRLWGYRALEQQEQQRETPEPESTPEPDPTPQPERPTPKPNLKGQIPEPYAIAETPTGRWIARWRNWPKGTTSQREVATKAEAEQLARDKFDEWVRQGQPTYVSPAEKSPRAAAAKNLPGRTLADRHGPLPVVAKGGRFKVTYRSLPSGNKSNRLFDNRAEAERFANEKWKAWKNVGQPTPQYYKSKAEVAEEVAARAPEPKVVVPRVADLPALGTMMRVAGLLLDDNDEPAILLRGDGEQSWFVSIVGRPGE